MLWSHSVSFSTLTAPDQAKRCVQLVMMLTQVILVNVPQLYTYTNADVLGVDSWIPVSSMTFCRSNPVGDVPRL